MMGGLLAEKLKQLKAKLGGKNVTRNKKNK